MQAKGGYSAPAGYGFEQQQEEESESESEEEEVRRSSRCSRRCPSSALQPGLPPLAPSVVRLGNGARQPASPLQAAVPCVAAAAQHGPCRQAAWYGAICGEAQPFMPSLNVCHLQTDDELDIEAELGIELAKTDDEAEESEEEEQEERREEGQRPGSADSAAAAKQQQQLSKKVRRQGGGWLGLPAIGPDPALLLVAAKTAAAGAVFPERVESGGWAVGDVHAARYPPPTPAVEVHTGQLPSAAASSGAGSHICRNLHSLRTPRYASV